MDTVFCCAAIHHFEDPCRLLREVARVLAPGGRFIAINESYRPPFRAQFRASRGSRALQAHLDSGIHEPAYTHRQYRRFIEQAGLTFSCIHPRWDVVQDACGIRVGRNIGLLNENYAISETAHSWLRRMAQRLRITRQLARNPRLAAIARHLLFTHTNAFRILVGTK